MLKGTLLLRCVNVVGANKNSNVSNHGHQERIALSHSGKRPDGTAATRESQDAFEKFSDVVNVVSPREVR